MLAIYSAGCPTNTRICRPCGRLPEGAHVKPLFSQHRSRLNMLDRPVSRLTFMSCFIATPLLYPVGNEPLGLCSDATPPPFGWLGKFLAVLSTQPIRLRRYAHHRTGCSTCSNLAPYCGSKQNAPVLLLSRRKPLLTNDDALY